MKNSMVCAVLVMRLEAIGPSVNGLVIQIPSKHRKLDGGSKVVVTQFRMQNLENEIEDEKCHFR